MLNIVYAGSPDISATVLKGLIDSGKVCIVAVLTNAPSAKGRHKTPIQTPVANVATVAGICVIEPEKLDATVREQIASLKPDLLVCFAFGKIFGPKFMALFPLGGVNLHASLLPKHRGCSPAPAAILAGDSETGLTVQRIALAMDTGDVLLQHKIKLNGTENSADILHVSTVKGTDLFLDALAAIEDGTECVVQQDESAASYCTMFKKEDGLIDWTKSAVEICALVRAMYPWPSAFTCSEGILLSIHSAHVFDGASGANSCGDFSRSTQSIPGTVLSVDKEVGILIQTGNGILAVQNLQKQGKKAMNWKDFINGTRNFAGTCCTNPKKPS